MGGLENKTFIADEFVTSDFLKKAFENEWNPFKEALIDEKKEVFFSELLKCDVEMADYEMYEDRIYKWIFDEKEQKPKMIPVTEDEDFVIRLFQKAGYTIHILNIDRMGSGDIRTTVRFIDGLEQDFLIPRDPFNGVTINTVSLSKRMDTIAKDVKSCFSAYCKEDLDWLPPSNREFRRSKGGPKYKRTRNNEKPKYWR